MEHKQDLIRKRLSRLFTQWSGEETENFLPLPEAGSSRKYYRITGKTARAIAVYHPVIRENEAFLYLTGHFRQKGLPVPAIYIKSPEKDLYLLEDLGDTTLFSLALQEHEKGGRFRQLKKHYAKALEHLVDFQVKGIKDLDHSKLCPPQRFDRRSMRWDLNYFKYNYLKLRDISFNEEDLENDFETILDELDRFEKEFFMYRDFQARNILLRDDELYFIDYQGGRMGPLAYDPVSLLNQVRADLPFNVRRELLDHYIASLALEVHVNKEEFLQQADSFHLLRLLQVLGAYGYRGIFQQKKHFLESLPYAAKNISWWLQNNLSALELPELSRLLEQIVDLESLDPLVPADRLLVSIYSFSYKKGFPVDRSGHGGGFVFDCRSLPNPGREERFRLMTGKDPLVSDYLLAENEVSAFIENVNRVVDAAVDNYIERDFRNLMVSFGCTGGQHRSVYCAEALAGHLRKKGKVKVEVYHTEIT